MPKSNKNYFSLWRGFLYTPVTLSLLFGLINNSALAQTEVGRKTLALPVKKEGTQVKARKKSADTDGETQTNSSLRGYAEQELSLTPLLSRMKAKSSSRAPLQVENLPIPPSVLKPNYTEAALTLSTLAPSGSSTIFGTQSYELSRVGSLPVLCGQVQHWLLIDSEKQQKLGFIIGTGVGEKKIDVNLSSGYTLSNVEILYMKMQAGLSWEQALYDDEFLVGLSGLFSEELWQQNSNQSMESRWSRWTPTLGLVAMGKWNLNQRWYSLVEIHNQWPMRDTQVDASMQRLHLGFGYHL